MLIKKFKLFLEKIKEFIFTPGKAYYYEDLPEQIKSDIDLHFEDVYDESPYDYKYVCRIIPNEELAEKVETHFGREWEEYAEREEVKELIEDIKNNGLKYPSVGSEGNHRMLAHY